MPEPAPATLPRTDRAGAAAVYLPSCTNRIFGRAADPNRRADGLTVPAALIAVSARAGVPLWIPPDVAGHCCATPWSSKGYADGFAHMAAKTAAALQRWTDGGRLPVVIAPASCSHGARENLRARWGGGPSTRSPGSTIGCSRGSPWTAESLRWWCTPRAPRAISVVSAKLAGIAATLADEVTVPAATRCCGMAGDRGLLHPELPRAALTDTARELDGRHFDACVSSNRTCELGPATR